MGTGVFVHEMRLFPISEGFFCWEAIKGFAETRDLSNEISTRVVNVQFLSSSLPLSAQMSTDGVKRHRERGRKLEWRRQKKSINGMAGIRGKDTWERKEKAAVRQEVIEVIVHTARTFWCLTLIPTLDRWP